MKALFWATSPGPKRLPHVDVDGQHNSSLMYKSAGRSAFVPPVQVGAAHTALGPSQTESNSLYSRAFKYGSRHPVETGAEAWGMETPPRS